MKYFCLISTIAALAACSPPKVSNVQKCTQTVQDYAEYRDDPNQVKAYGALFSEDGVFTLGPNRSTGRPAIIERHKSSNSAMKWNHTMGEISISEDLTGQSRVIVYTTPLGGSDGDITRFILADYYDTYEIDGQGHCLIKSRKVDVLFDSSTN